MPLAPLHNAHALVVGIADYQHIRPLPPTVVHDAEAIATVLRDPAFGAYPPEQVTLLCNEQASRGAILAALAALAANSGEDAVVTIYLSCHGGRIDTGPHAGAYLLPVDTVYTSQQLPLTAISDAEFTHALEHIRAQRVAVFFDCCHAGGIGEPEDLTAPPMTAGLPHALYESLKDERFIMASSREDEESYVIPGDTNSVFTKYLLEGLRGGIGSEDGVARIYDLFEYLQPRVTAAQPYQHPLLKGDLEENLPLARFLGGRKNAVQRDEQGYQYDAFIHYTDAPPDSDWVWATLIPRLQSANLRLVVSCDSDTPGVGRVVNIERGMAQAKRTVPVLSSAYLQQMIGDFLGALGHMPNSPADPHRLRPVFAEPIDQSQLPERLRTLTALDLSNRTGVEAGFQQLIGALREPLPRG
jgi:hypothetical protein